MFLHFHLPPFFFFPHFHLPPFFFFPRAKHIQHQNIVSLFRSQYPNNRISERHSSQDLSPPLVFAGRFRGNDNPTCLQCPGCNLQFREIMYGSQVISRTCLPSPYPYISFLINLGSPHFCSFLSHLHALYLFHCCVL